MDDWNIKGRVAVDYRRVKNFHQELSRLILQDVRPLQATFAHRKDAVPLAQSFDLPRVPIQEGEVWGRTWDSGYFRLTGTLPSEWAGKDAVAWLDFGCEGLVYSPSAEPLWSLTHGSAFDAHYTKDIYHLPASCQPGQPVELWVETAANNLFGIKEAPAPARKDDPARHGTWEARLNRAALAVFDRECWHLFLDIKVFLDLWECLDPTSVRAERLLRALLQATHTFQGDTTRAAKSRALLAPQLALPAAASALSTTVVGHAHIDTAWLWQLRETRRKVARTFSSQLSLIDRYPGYVFGASAPQHHQWTKEDHPALYERLKVAVASGRWEPQGGMWIEADCNLPSGESLVRQFLHGKNFWKDEFGVDVRTCWIPDVFGYSGSLPQIMKKAGIDAFLTQKLSWSKFNVFPHDTFRWRGIDGTEIVTHFPPEYTYNSYVLPEALRRAEKTFHEKAFLDEFITLMGIGDGGGGPKEEHLEHTLRARNTEGVPKAAFGRSDDLLRRLAAHAAELDVWSGELYLEYHRGTYTTQARTKANNRRLEERVRAVEALYSALPLEAYPQRALDAVVKTMLLHQFHDILPGSSIHAVYEDADAAYAEAFATLDALAGNAAAKLLAAEPGAVTLFNVLPEAWEGTLALPASFEGRGARVDGHELPAHNESGTVLVRVSVPPLGSSTLKPGAPAPAAVVGDPLVLENERVRYRFNADAQLVEAFDKEAGRSILPSGAAGNVLTYYEDTPHNFDAWDVDYYYPAQQLETARGVGHRSLGSGPAGQGVRFELAVGTSTIVQIVRLAPQAKLLTFATEVDWHESRRLLRTTFPVATLATEATCDVAYGAVKRPTHRNTDWDWAKFEVCAHRWADVGDPVFGAALLNDAKYGYSVTDNVLGLTLLRSPLYPDPDADQGRHSFTYAFLPRSGPLEASELRRQAAALNQKPLAFADRAGEVELPVTVSGEGFTLEALKKAEKRDAWVVRVVESRGLGAQGVLHGPVGWHAAETDLLEWNDGAWSPVGPGRAFALAPFEIRTFVVAPGAGTAH